VVSANNTATREETHAPSSRAATVGSWVLQIALAATFLMAGGSKLAGAAAMVALFDAIGWGQWFRYLTGIVEITAAIVMLVPPVAGLGALLASATMLGAVVTNIFLGQSPIVPLALLVGAAAVAWLRRDQLAALASIGRGARR
jgi:putative oxidoreductase